MYFVFLRRHFFLLPIVLSLKAPFSWISTMDDKKRPPSTTRVFFSTPGALWTRILHIVKQNIRDALPLVTYPCLCILLLYKKKANTELVYSPLINS